MPDITLVLGVDAKTLPQFDVSHRTWKLHQPKIWSWPWVVFYDGLIETMPIMLQQRKDRGEIPQQAKVVPWPQCIGGNSRKPKYESQREKMLSGFAYVAAEFVETPWWAKIDTDAICHRASEWPNEEWFAPSGELAVALGVPHNPVSPVVVAPGWNYTKGINFLGRLEEWGDQTYLIDYPRLNIPFDPTHLRVPHRRWCSWNSFYETEWTRWFVGLLEQGGMDPGKLPIPSQDSTMWYAAERQRLFVRTVPMKKFGWNNYPKLDKLIEVAQSVMRGEAQEVMVDG